MGASPDSKVPVLAYFNHRTMCCATHDVRHLLRDAYRLNADASNQFPRKVMMQQELGLLAFLDVRGAEVGHGHRRPVHFIELIEAGAVLRVERASIRQRECPPAP